jgi:predicted PurR-regulated permease PerM
MESTQMFRVTAMTVLGISVIAALVIGQPLLMPIVFSMVLAFVLSPIVRALEHRRIPTTLAVTAVVTVVTLIAGTAFTLVGQQLSSLLTALPQHSGTIKEKVSAFRFTQNSGFEGLWEMWDEVAGEFERNVSSSTVNAIPVVVQSDANQTSSLAFIWPMLEPFGAIALVVVLVIFLLVSRNDIRNRILAIVGTQRLAGTSHLMEEVGERLGRYLLCLCAVNISFALLFGISLALIGVPYPFLWALLTGVLRFIPYVGSTLSMLLPAALALATLPGWSSAIAVVVIFGILEFSSGNLVEPWLFGRSVGLNPVGVLISVAFWAWAWGAGGMVLAMPLTLSIVVLAKYIPQLKWISILLGNEVSLQPHLVLYQRLMAGDVNEAAALCHVNGERSVMIKTLDCVTVPAIKLAKREADEQTLSSEDYQRVLHATRGAYQASPAAAKSTETEAPSFIVRVVPLRTEIDEVLGEALSKALVFQFSSDCTAIDEIQRVAADTPVDSILLSAMPNHNMSDVIEAYSRLRQGMPQTPMVLVYWKKIRNAGKLRRFLSKRLGEPVLLATSAFEAINTVSRLRTSKVRTAKSLATAAIDAAATELAVS